MGSLVQSSCRECGLEQEIRIGGGMLNHKTVADFPCCCPGCSNLITANMFLNPQSCADCGEEIQTYLDPSLSSGNGQHKICIWNMLNFPHSGGSTELYLDDGDYLCPHCKTFGMRFRKIGNFD